jgi:hypothetical protein
MTLNKIPEKKELQLQYITDDSGNKTAIILSLSKFDELIDKTTQLAKQATELQKALQSSYQEIKGLQAALSRAETTRPQSDNLEEKLLLLKEHYEWLNKIVAELREYEPLQREMEHKLQILRFINMVDTKQQEIGRKLGELKKLNQYVTMSHVPALPTPFVKNESLFNEVKTKLLAEISSKQRPPIVLQGHNGMGKSVMAAALGHDTDIQHAFPDGIFWLRLNADADLLERQIALVYALDEKSTIDFIEIEGGAERLRKLCATRFCLIILDDVLDAQDISAFNLMGQHCQLLITTPDNNFLEFAQYFLTTPAEAYEIKPFTEQQAIEFISHYVENIPVNIVRACDYSPLVLKLIANVAPKLDSSELIERLQDKEYEFPDNYPRTLMLALHINVEALGESADYYLALAVFSDYSQIPQFVVLILWRYLYQLGDNEAIKFINELADKGLLQIDDSSSQRTLSLHTFQREYLEVEAELEKLHEHMLAAYRRQCSQHGWVSGPNDGYFFKYLCMHLHYAGRDNELKQLLLDFDWIQNKLKATTVPALLNDYEWLEDKDIERVKNVLSEAALPLLKNKQELANQLLDNLWGDESLQDNKDIQALLNQAKEAAPDWQPYFPTWTE